MLKKLPWKSILIVLLTLVVTTVIWEIRDYNAGEKQYFLYRWLYSNKSYAKNIEVLTYTLTAEQVAHMLTHPEEEIKQPTQKELFLKDVYAVLRIRNLYNRVAGGRILWSRTGHGWNVVDVKEIPIPLERRARKYGDIIISLGLSPSKNEDIIPDPIIVKWDELYLYR